MDYFIYHDESKEDGFWHIFLFIPSSFNNLLLTKLLEAKWNSGYAGRRLTFKDLRSDNSFICARIWLSIICAAFEQVRKHTIPHFITCKSYYSMTSGRRQSEYEGSFCNPPKCKVAIFRQERAHSDMSGHIDNLSKLETTFRMGMQGAAHFLFNDDNPVNITKIILDEEKHYLIEHHRDIDKNKILKRFSANARGYCGIDENCRIMGQGLSPEEIILTDLADIFLGTFKFGVINSFGEINKNFKFKNRRNLCEIIKPLIIRLNEGYARMRNSRFADFGTFSSASIVNNDWEFNDMTSQFMREVAGVQTYMDFGE